MNALRDDRADFDEQQTLVMPNRPGAVSGVMPQGRAVSGVMPVAREAGEWVERVDYASEVFPTADVLASYPPATAEPTPSPSSMRALTPSLAPVSMSEPIATYAYQGSYAFGPPAPSDGRGKVAFIILLGFFLGIGGAYGYQVWKHSPEEPAPPAAAAAPKAAETSLPPKAEAKPVEAMPPAEAKPADLKDAKPADLKDAKPVDAKPVDAKPKAEPKPQVRTPRAPRPPKPAEPPSLDGRDLLNEGLD